VPLEIQVDVSATFVLNICCFITSRNTSWGRVVSVPLEMQVGVSVPLVLKMDVSVPLYLQVDVSPPLDLQVDVSVPTELQVDVSKRVVLKRMFQHL